MSTLGHQGMIDIDEMQNGYLFKATIVVCEDGRESAASGEVFFDNEGFYVQLNNLRLAPIKHAVPTNSVLTKNAFFDPHKIDG